MKAPVRPSTCCPAAQMRRVPSAVIYPHRPDLGPKLFFRCDACSAYVGCHPDGEPLGVPAGPQLRRARQRAHRAFDALWRGPTRLFDSRPAAYAWLAKRLGLSSERAHMAQMDETLCSRVFDVCMDLREERLV